MNELVGELEGVEGHSRALAMRPMGEVLGSVVAALKEEILATPAGPPPPPRQKPRFPYDFM